jgi:hypothetical protein
MYTLTLKCLLLLHRTAAAVTQLCSVLLLLIVIALHTYIILHRPHLQAGSIFTALGMQAACQTYRKQWGDDIPPAESIKSVIAGKVFPSQLRKLARDKGLHVIVYTDSEWQFEGAPSPRSSHCGFAVW